MRLKGKSLIIGSFLVAMFFAVVGSYPANAQGKGKAVRKQPRRVIVYRTFNPFWYRYYDPFYYPRYVVVDPIAYQREQGYSEGKDEGEEDAEKGRTANPTGHKDYLESDSLYFREAFVQGYNEGYREEIAEIQEEMREKRRGD